MRYFFEIAYNGKAYHGWQNQDNAVSIQAVLEDALTKLLSERIAIVGSGRTDTGVHCRQQFFHADIGEKLDINKLLGKLNAFLPRDIAISSIMPVAEDAHARYSAISRSYEYIITLKKNPFLYGFALHYHKDVKVQTMCEAAALLVGMHDFACFSKVKTDVNHFHCTVEKADWRQEDALLIFNITANRFLRGMVRAVVGTLLEVGSGKITVHDFKTILQSKDRRRAGQNVSPHGLYLTSVKYPATIFLNGNINRG